MLTHYLRALFAPRCIAVFGASNRPESVGTRVYRNLLEGGFRGAIYPINPKHSELDGQPCYPQLDATPEAPDLAVVATPATTVPGIIRQCGDAGVSAAIVLSAGFGESGEAGRALENELVETARRVQVRILGPNCLGLMRPGLSLNATFSDNAAQPGTLALVSQSGALCTAILDWAQATGVGFSAMVSLGDAADIGFGDLLDFLAMDADTRSILLYVEGVRDARRFVSGLRAAARLKPVVVVKSGRHVEGSRAARSHTGALIGADDVFDAALRRAGVVRAYSIAQLFAAAQLLATPKRASGEHLAIVTNAGGPGVMATDHAVEMGVPLASLDADTIARLNAELPSCWSHANPIDVLGDATPERYALVVGAALADPQVDGLLVMLTPQAMTQPTAAADAVIAAAAPSSKPVLTCWMGRSHVEQARQHFAAAQVPTFSNPESSIEAFSFLTHYQRNQRLLLRTPAASSGHHAPDVDGARLVVEAALAERREWLTAMETKALLAAFHIPTVPAQATHSANEALVAAEFLGFPVVLKIDSPDIQHKSDVDGVRLNISNARAVREAYQELLAAVHSKQPEARIHGVMVEKMHHSPHGRELLVGVSQDPVFGPAIAFGAGGTAVEILHDRSIELPPLDERLAYDLIDRTHIARLLDAYRNHPAVDRGALVQLLLRVSELVCALPELRELDLNPLIADATGVVAVDARAAIGFRPPGQARYGHMAIHPYPAHLVNESQLPDGTNLTIRPIRPEDAEMTQAFVRQLSEESRYFRFMQAVQELSAEVLVRLTQIDYDRELALIATTTQYHEEIELGVARYFTLADGETGEFTLVVDDRWQGKGIGTRLLAALTEAARSRGLRRLLGEILPHNHRMLELMHTLGFQCETGDDGLVVAILMLRV